MRAVRSLHDLARVPLRISRQLNISIARSMCQIESAPSRPYGRFCVLISGWVMK